MDIQLIPEAVTDYELLNRNLKNLINEKIEELRKNPLLGIALENKHGIDLTGFYKIYVAKKTYRIVYRIVKDKVEIWGIGKRDKMEIYRNIGARISDRK